MAAQSWPEWLSGLLSSIWPQRPPAPGSHEAHLESLRVGALLTKELRKPAAQRDEELVHKLRVHHRQLELKNAEASLRKYKQGAVCFDRSTRQCCGAAQWVAQRVAASYRAAADFYEQTTQQWTEELAAAEARRQPVIAAQPTLRLDLTEALQQAPPRLDMCAACARMLQQVEVAEETCRTHAAFLRDNFQQRGMRAAPATAAARSGALAGTAAAPAAGAPGAAAPPADLPAGEAQQGQQAPVQQQQQQEQQQCGSYSVAAAEGAPTTPKQSPLPQQQHSSSEKEQR
ncbi:hypothetical protein COHA_007707 [Chlorella ohadii]|uniref:Uncharacterized protein n=1 Tax=Chlorella ohadii TaxID=2649997 RepID=A0AAD5GZK8_9CHLO|nr:hypothetical protein COHA_007707 [Chlorella ohadii]